MFATFLIVFGGKYYLPTTRGLVWIAHPDPINALKAAGYPVITCDQATYDSFTSVLKPAP